MVERIAPRAGAWIEIQSDQRHLGIIEIAPRAGAWIEIIIHRSRAG